MKVGARGEEKGRGLSTTLGRNTGHALVLRQVEHCPQPSSMTLPSREIPKELFPGKEEVWYLAPDARGCFPLPAFWVSSELSFGHCFLAYSDLDKSPHRQSCPLRNGDVSSLHVY